VEAFQFMELSHVLRVFFFHLVQSFQDDGMTREDGDEIRQVNAPWGIMLRQLTGNKPVAARAPRAAPLADASQPLRAGLRACATPGPGSMAKRHWVIHGEYRRL
jgi:hypothetical protein